MDINRGNLSAIFRSLVAGWQEVLDGAAPMEDVELFVSRFPSNTASNFYPWLDKIPGFRKWVGDRVYNNVRGNKFEVVNEDYEDSVRLDANDIEDDQVGMYGPMVRMMAQSWLDLQRAEAIKVFTENRSTFTGKALMANDHGYGDQTLDNLTTSALDASAFNAAFEAAAAWTFSNGELVRPRFTHLIVGEALRSTAWSLVKAQQRSDAANNLVDNPNYQRVELVIWPELAGTYANHWYLVDTTKAVKPVLLQLRKEAQPMMDTDPATVERSGSVDLLASGRLATAPTFPHLVYGGRVAA